MDVGLSAHAWFHFDTLGDLSNRLSAVQLSDMITLRIKTPIEVIEYRPEHATIYAELQWWRLQPR